MLTESDQELPEDVTEEAVPTKSKSAADIALDIAMIILAPILIPTTFGLLTFLEIKESRKACLDCKSRKLTPLGCRQSAEPIEEVPKDKSRHRTPAPYNYYQCAACGSQFKSRFGEALIKSNPEENK